MKKIKLIAILMVLTCACLAQPEQKKNKVKNSQSIRIDLGKITTYSEHKNIVALTTPDTLEILAVGIQPDSSFPQANLFKYDPYIYFEYSDSLILQLQAINKKYKEWLEVAHANKTGKFQKK